MRTPIAFIFGALAATLVAAAAFRGGGQPVDSTFTYQGQLRNAGQLVNGSVDVRFTLWDSDVGGTQIGNTNSFTNYPLTDGRFALGLNFGNGAFNGDQRWVQIEFRSPAGVGQYLTLNPRDKIMATPYALYALNGTASQWDYNPKTQSLTAAANVSKVGIGTSTPTAALEVVSATGGDDAVKLPAGSIGAGELAQGTLASGALDISLSASGPNYNVITTRTFVTASPTVFSFHGSVSARGGSSGGTLYTRLDGATVVQRSWPGYSGGEYFFGDDLLVSQELPAGVHTLEFQFVASGVGDGISRTATFSLMAVATPQRLDFTTP
jgi:hypothetical protein